MQHPDTGTRLGRYNLLRPLGCGGMADVWLAREDGPFGFQKLVAIKRLLPHLRREDQFVRMFLDEARIAARIDHPNVVQIFDLGLADDTLFIVMEYLEGENLARVMGMSVERNYPIPEALAARITSQMCTGLHHAHGLCDAAGTSLGVIHRDVSPQNVMLLSGGGVKLLDFGIARARQRLGQTTGPAWKGKYGYVSPEQCQGGELDRRTDIFSVGVVLWELLARQRLFRHQDPRVSHRMVLEATIPPPSRANPNVPPVLDRICLKALARDPRDRFQTAHELSAALDDSQGTLDPSHTAPKLSEYLRVLGGEGGSIVEITTRHGRAALAQQLTSEQWLDRLPGSITQSLRAPAISEDSPTRHILRIPTDESPTAEHWRPPALEAARTDESGDLAAPLLGEKTREHQRLQPPAGLQPSEPSSYALTNPDGPIIPRSPSSQQVGRAPIPFQRGAPQGQDGAPRPWPLGWRLIALVALLAAATVIALLVARLPSRREIQVQPLNLSAGADARVQP